MSTPKKFRSVPRSREKRQSGECARQPAPMNGNEKTPENSDPGRTIRWSVGTMCIVLAFVLCYLRLAGGYLFVSAGLLLLRGRIKGEASNIDGKEKH